MPSTDSTLFEFIVLSSFVLTLIGMAAGSLFFFAERNAVPIRYRALMSVSGVILFIAAANYWYMTTNFATLSASGDEQMITLYRYVDWILTTPLMLIKFPLILGLGPRGRGFMVRLIVLDLAMIFFGFFGELQAGRDTVLHLGLFGAGFLCWILIFASLFKAMSSLPASISESVRKGVRFMFFFVLIGWTIYPIGYLMPSFGFGEEVKHLIYNIGDLINKVGLAVVVYLAIVASVKTGEAGAAR